MSNADLLDSIHGSASREANKYLALGSDAMFPDGAVRNIQGGLDADKSASPVRSDMYIAWDTGRVYACFTAGVWTDITPIVGDVRLMAYNYSINEHKYIGLDPATKALKIKREIAATFLQLADTPSSYAGYANKFPRVKAGEDGLEFAVAPTGVTDHGELTGLADDDHVQYYNQARGDARYLRLAGGTMTGLLTLSGAPTLNLHASTKKYVDDNVGVAPFIACYAHFGALPGPGYGGSVPQQDFTSSPYEGKIKLDYTLFDTHSKFDTSNWWYVIPYSGYYFVKGQYWCDLNMSADELYKIYIARGSADPDSWYSGAFVTGTSHSTSHAYDVNPCAATIEHFNQNDKILMGAASQSGFKVDGRERHFGHRTFLLIYCVKKD